MRSKIGFWISLALIGAFISIAAYAQRPAETVAAVPELTEFHKVIFKIWHEAWPQKNANLLQQLTPDVEKGIASVSSAQLPGILRDKKAAWNEGVKKLQAIGLEYKAAADSKESARLLIAAENLHRQFEFLARTISPAIDELDEFHAVLYMLYHHYLPENNAAKIKTSSEELKQKMASLNAAALPGRLKQKEQQFDSAKAELSKSVDVLTAAIQSNAEPKIKDAIETLHTNYQRLEKIFE
jgi:hypothetical protein